MKYSLRDIYNQAKDDKHGVATSNSEYDAVSLYDCKITSYGEEDVDVLILNTGLCGLWYTNLSKHEVKVFTTHGWRAGVYELTLSNYRTKLNNITDDIKAEVNGRQNPKKIKSLKNSREQVMEGYYKLIVKKFNLI